MTTTTFVDQNTQHDIIERAEALRTLLGSAGWKLVLDFLDGECGKADKRLLELESADPLVIIAAQRYARALRMSFDGIQQYAKSQIRLADQIREAQQRQHMAPEEPIYG